MHTIHSIIVIEKGKKEMVAVNTTDCIHIAKQKEPTHHSIPTVGGILAALVSSTVVKVGSIQAMHHMTSS